MSIIPNEEAVQEPNTVDAPAGSSLQEPNTGESATQEPNTGESSLQEPNTTG
jgi:hypothetical protein